ncbi:permease [Chitinolyticbacter meiyuanensis]|uniref:permease n=1 Tax=Chitinolyticbacter meiyuanensis TaxID=682798 RepID=UPI0011E5DC25|nr:permease [Chitinolyticbacter meiyuanensis]
MKPWTLLLATGLLSACQLLQPPPPHTPVPTPVPTPEPVIYVEEVPNAVDEVLGYAARVRGLANGDLAKELAALAGEPVDPANTIKRALLLARSHGELPRAISQLDLVIKSVDPDAAAFKPLAQLLQSQWQERRKLEDQADKLAQQLKDEQRRADEATTKLEALKKIENTLPARPSASGK